MSLTTYLFQRESGGVVVAQGETPEDAKENVQNNVSVSHPFGEPLPLEDVAEKAENSNHNSVVLW